MASAQDIPQPPGRGDLGPEGSGEEPFGGALLTGAEAPADPWALLAEQLEWELRRIAPLASSPPLAAADASWTAALPSPALATPAPPAEPVAADAQGAAAGPSRPDLVAIEKALTGATSELPTKPSLPAPPAHYGQWRAQAQARGLRSVFIAAADDFTSAPPPTSAPELLAAPPTTAATAATAATATTAATAATSATAATAPTAATSVTSVTPASPPPPQPARLRAVPRTGGLLGAVQRPSPPPPAPLPTESAPTDAKLSTPPKSRLRALAAEASQVVGQSARQGRALLRRLLSADRGAAPPGPPTPD